MKTETLLEVLRRLELKLHQPQVRSDPETLGRLLHPNFREFGRSGRIYERVDVLREFTDPPKDFEIRAQDFRVLRLSNNVVLLTYKSAHVTREGVLERHTNRSSLWQLSEGGWQLVFHQGTPTDEFPRNSA